MRLIHGDCLEVLPTLPGASVDAVITDPPYPEINRPYGKWTEAEWWEMMMAACKEVRRLLKPTGSAVFILQPNSRKVGSMRGWLWEFMVWVCREWNLVQDAWWWNFTALPVGGAITAGLMRGSVKACVWAGPSDCWREQEAVLWEPGEHHMGADEAERRGVETHPSGHSVNRPRMVSRHKDRGGVTPFNLIPVANNRSRGDDAGANGHGAGTPLALCRWWVRYICPRGGAVLDPFAGSGTVGVACHREGREFVGVERVPEYVEIARRRIGKEQDRYSLFERNDHA